MPKRYEKELPVKLSEPEIAKRAKLMARTALEAAKQEVEIESAKEAAKARLNAMKEDLLQLRGDLRDLAREVRNGESIQPVEVEARIAPDNSRVEVIRLDTGEVVSERALTDQDRQMEIDEVLDRIQQESERSELDAPTTEELLDFEDGDDGDEG